jgi:anti-anti-sigma factor
MSEKPFLWFMMETNIRKFLRKSTILLHPMFSVTIQNDGRALVLAPNGRLDTLSHPVFEREMKPLLESEAFLIIDFSHCPYLSSSGIRLLISANKQLASRGGTLMLTSLPPEVFQVIEMTGLLSVFKVFRNNEEAWDHAARARNSSLQSGEYTAGGFHYHFQQLESQPATGLMWEEAGIAGYDELGFAAGTGTPAGSLEEELEQRGLFLTIGNCGGFIPDSPDEPSDFRVVHDPAGAGVFVAAALSAGTHPWARVRLTRPFAVSFGEMLMHLESMPKPSPTSRLLALAVADFTPGRPSITGYFPGQIHGNKPAGLTFNLSNLPDLQSNEPFQQFAARALTLDQLDSVEPVDEAQVMASPTAWLFYAEEIKPADGQRIHVEFASGGALEPYQLFLARRLYTDSGRVVVKPLHGGYSAQTFQVESFDKEGRRLRPTVLKIGNRAMVARESDRCRQYALPYILNNSAQVLGTVFYAGMGALRYNFVGIGGEQTQLKWLTHLFNSWKIEELEPLFDKIFLQILNPWYGQPVKAQLFPYRDHDPTATFFGNLCETAETELGISADVPEMTIPETGESTVNPYWFLRHGFRERRDWQVDYYSGICHGDLNMQNILLDQDMNVYLIDFSETRPRAAISDFARLEAIFMIEHAQVEEPADMLQMIRLIRKFYQNEDLNQLPEVTWTGSEPGLMNRNLRMCLKMRQYSIKTVSGAQTIVPYYLAMLEWVLPIVCYGGVTLNRKKLSAYVAGLLCEQLIKA